MSNESGKFESEVPTLYLFALTLCMYCNVFLINQTVRPNLRLMGLMGHYVVMKWTTGDLFCVPGNSKFPVEHFLIDICFCFWHLTCQDLEAFVSWHEQEMQNWPDESAFISFLLCCRVTKSVDGHCKAKSLSDIFTTNNYSLETSIMIPKYQLRWISKSIYEQWTL